MMRTFMMSLRVGLVAAILFVGWTFLSRSMSPVRHPVRDDNRQSAAAAEFDRLYGGTDVRILNFYSRDASVVEGGTSLLCYGVVNAKSVRIDPPVQEVSPSISRCVEIPGERAVRYTLTAQGFDGRMVSESFLLGTHPDPDKLPRITSFRAQSKTLDYLGNPVYLVSFTAENPEEVSMDPPVLSTLHRAPYGRFYVAPKKTTTYTLTVTGVFGHKATAQLTLEGPTGKL